MRYAIISDIHGNLEALEAVLEHIRGLKVDQTVCLGDVVGYGASPNECCEVLREAEIPTICGNHDAVACGIEEPWGFNPVALQAVMWTRQSLSKENLDWLKNLPDNMQFKDFLATHGSPTDRDCYLFTWEDVLPHLSYVAESQYDLCFFGHTHSPGIFSADGIYSVDEDSKFALGEGKTFFINPGSVGQPRDGDPRAAYGLYNSAKREYEHVRVAYPVEVAAAKIIEAGLPAFLAERLALGK